MASVRAERNGDYDDERRPLLGTPSINSVETDATVPCDENEPSAATSSFSCRHCVKSYVPIEPLLCAYTFCRIIVSVLTGFYFFDQASRMYGDPSMDSLNPCGNSTPGHGDRTRADEVQKEYLQLGMMATFSNYLTAILPTIFLGPATDMFGRRIGFALPMLGTMLRAVVFLIVLGTNASVYYIYIGTVLEGLGGGFGSFLMTTFSTAADVTTPGRQRAMRICIIEALQVMASALANFTGGQWRRHSYTQPVMLAAVLGTLVFIYTLFGWTETLKPIVCSTAPTSSSPRPGLPERCDPENEEEEALNAARRELLENSAESSYTSFSPTGHRLSAMATNLRQSARSTGQQHAKTLRNSHQEEKGKEDGSDKDPRSYSGVQTQPEVRPHDDDCLSCCSTGLRNVRRGWDVYFRHDADCVPARRRVLTLCFICFLLTVAVNFSKPSVETAFRLGQLCWNAVQESEFDSGWLVQHWVFILITLFVLKKCVRVSDATVALIGCVSAFCAPLIFSFATLPDISEYTANVFVFVSAGSGTLARVLIPMLRAMSSAVVNVDEQGSLFTSYACVELGGAALFDIAATQVYKATVHLWKGIVFVIMAAFFVVVFVLLIILSVVQKRARRKTEADQTIAKVPSKVNDYGGI